MFQPSCVQPHVCVCMSTVTPLAPSGTTHDRHVRVKIVCEPVRGAKKTKYSAEDVQAIAGPDDSFGERPGRSDRGARAGAPLPLHAPPAAAKAKAKAKAAGSTNLRRPSPSPPAIGAGAGGADAATTGGGDNSNLKRQKTFDSVAANLKTNRNLNTKIATVGSGLAATMKKIDELDAKVRSDERDAYQLEFLRVTSRKVLLESWGFTATAEQSSAMDLPSLSIKRALAGAGEAEEKALSDRANFIFTHAPTEAHEAWAKVFKATTAIESLCKDKTGIQISKAVKEATSLKGDFSQYDEATAQPTMGSYHTAPDSVDVRTDRHRRHPPPTTTTATATPHHHHHPHHYPTTFKPACTVTLPTRHTYTHTHTVAQVRPLTTITSTCIPCDRCRIPRVAGCGHV